MGVSLWALVLAAPWGTSSTRPLSAAVTATNPPEMIAVPPAVEGRPARESLAAWKAIKSELHRARQRMGVSTRLQRKQHRFLIGPAREQARDCGFNVPCLVDVGSTLGADILVSGLVGQDRVILLAIDVGAGRQIAEAASTKAMDGQSGARRARFAARNLFRLLGRREQIPAAVAAAPPSPSPATDVPNERSDTDRPAPEQRSPVAVEVPSQDASEVSSQQPIEGHLEISASQLPRVTAVRLDGEPLSLADDGAVRWSGPAGDHALVVERIDGARIVRNVVVEPGSTTRLILEFPDVVGPTAPSTPIPLPPGPQTAADSVLGKWWFWTSLGAAVVVGASTATLLAIGSQGGPRFANDTGTIQGLY